MWEIQEDGVRSHYYDDWSMLDQIMVIRCMLETGSGLTLVPDSCGIHKTDAMLRRGKPRHFGRPSKSLDLAGYSDHLPIYCRIRKL